MTSSRIGRSGATLASRVSSRRFREMPSGECARMSTCGCLVSPSSTTVRSVSFAYRRMASSSRSMPCCVAADPWKVTGMPAFSATTSSQVWNRLVPSSVSHMDPVILVLRSRNHSWLLCGTSGSSMHFRIHAVRWCDEILELTPIPAARM